MKKEEIKQVYLSLSMDIAYIREALETLVEELSAMRDNHEWTGKNAYQYYKNCITQINCNYELLEQLEKNMSYIESLSK